MTIDQAGIMHGAIGGLILGVACSINFAVRGQVTGMSGAVFGIVSLDKKTLPEKLALVGGMFLASALFFLKYNYGGHDGFMPFGPKNQIDTFTSTPGFFVAGFLIGFGAKLSNGCTSGHGLCGLPRLSPRSIVAVMTFLPTAIATSSYGYKYGLGFLTDKSYNFIYEVKIDHYDSSWLLLFVGVLMPIIGFMIARKNSPTVGFITHLSDQILVFIIGILFAIGLMVAGMSRRKNILDFVQVNSPEWNPALLFVLGCGVIFNFIFFQIFMKRGYSLNGCKVFQNTGKIDFKLIFGAFCFGLGWGLGGLCPGPFLILFTVFTVPIQIAWGTGLILGMSVVHFIAKPRIKAKQI